MSLLTTSQKREFAQDGYLRVPGVVPKLMIDRARHAMIRSIGSVGRSGEDPTNSRTAYFCAELAGDRVLLDLFHETPVFRVVEELLGIGNLLPLERAKPAPRFPCDPSKRQTVVRGHIDGIGNGRNGIARGDYLRDFTAMAILYLRDVKERYSGNFTIWPRSHVAIARYLAENGHEVLANGMPDAALTEQPVMLTADAGDLILAHCLLVHAGGVNHSTDIRYAVLGRFKHKDCDAIGKAGYTDLWREWPGLAGTVTT